MLGELTVIEQRYLAVRDVLDNGAKVIEVATRYGVDRRTVHRWLTRYASEGLGALADRSHRPDTCPHQMTPAVEACIVDLRKTHPGWGPRTLLTKLRKELEDPPSRSAIYRCLVRHRLIDPAPRRRKASDYRRWERSRAMELWQIDVMGGVRLADGSQLSVVTGIDDQLAGQTVSVESKDGLLHVTHNGVVVATHARRHNVEDDALMDGSTKARKPAKPTMGTEVLRKVDPHGAVSFAGTAYLAGRRYRGQVVGVRLVG